MFTEWLIKKIGGYTKTEYREMELRYDAIANAHEKTLSWFVNPRTSSYKTQKHLHTLTSIHVLNEYDPPIEFIKEQLSQQITKELISNKGVSFDVDNDPISNKKILRGTLIIYKEEY